MNEQIKQTEIIVVLDKSGSMGSIASATVNGFNTFLNEQQNAEGEAFVTLIQFDDRYEVNYKSVPVKEVMPLINKETYIPRGSTALYESIGRTIQELNTDRDVVFVIITDGYDNVKSDFKPEAINKMIETLQSENGWKFLFLAANQDAVVAGGRIGIKGTNSMSYAATADGIGNSFMSMSSNLGTYRKGKLSSISMAEIQSLESELNFTDLQRKKSI